MWFRLDRGERIYIPDKYFTNRSGMTFIFDPETYLKFTATPLSNSTIHVCCCRWRMIHIIYYIYASMYIYIFIFIAPNKYFTYKHLSIYTWNLGSRSHKPFTIRHPGGELWPDLAKSREKKMCPRQVMSAWWTDDDRWFPLGCLQRDVAFVAALTALM